MKHCTTSDLHFRQFILKLLTRLLNLEFLFSLMHAVGPQIKEQLEAAKDPEIGEVVSAQLSSVCGVKNENFSNFFLPLLFTI